MRLYRTTVYRPRDGWSLEVAETGATLNAPTFAILVSAVLRHMVANGVVPPDPFEEWVRCEWCRQHGNHPKFCKARRDPAPVKPAGPGAQAWRVLRFLASVAAWLRGGGQFVGQAEAERRAAICAACPANKPVAGCRACQGIPGLVFRTKGRRSTTRDRQLGACDVCGCSLEVKVHIPGDALDNRGLSYPPGCWQNAPPTPPES